MINLKTGKQFDGPSAREQMTRREFGKGLAAIIGAGVAPSIALGATRIVSRTPMLAGSANGGVGRGMMRGVGGRMAAMSCEWKNPYITDRLIAMWDGEWNAGGGVHDISSALWKDLSGSGHDLTVNRSNGSFGSLCAILNGTGVFAKNSSAIPYSLIKTIECVCVWTNYEGIGRHAMFFSGSTYFYQGWNYSKKMVAFHPNGGFTFNGWPICGNSKKTSGTMRSYSVSFDSNDNGTIMFNNVIVENDITFGSSVSNTQGVCIGGFYDGDSNVANYASGRIYNIRLYSKVLSPMEVSYNYDVDVLRFGIV